MSEVRGGLEARGKQGPAYLRKAPWLLARAWAAYAVVQVPRPMTHSSSEEKDSPGLPRSAVHIALLGMLHLGLSALVNFGLSKLSACSFSVCKRLSSIR